MLKKAHDLLLQARNETNLRKASLLRKASADTYNEMIAFSFIYGVVNEEDDFAKTTMAMKASGDMVTMVANLIVDRFELKGIKAKLLAKRFAVEFFNVQVLAQQKFYEKMIKDFTFSLKSVDKAEDAVHNMLSGLNPVTEGEFVRREAYSPFAHAGSAHQNLPKILKNSVEASKANSLFEIPNKYKDCIASILSTISIYTQRLKYNRPSVAPVSMSTLVDEEGKEISGILPSDTETPETFTITTINENIVDKFIDLFTQGYGWGHIRSPKPQRRALAHIFFCMKVHYDYASLKGLATTPEEQELLELLDYNPQDLLMDGRVERDAKLYTSLKKLIEVVTVRSSDFIDELLYIYNDISEAHSDPITQSAGQKAFDAGWSTFLEQVSSDIKKLKTKEPISIPSAYSAIESFKGMLRQGSLRERLARLIGRIKH